MNDFDVIWNGDAHGPSRGLLADAETVFLTRPAPVLSPGGAMINRTKPRRTRGEPRPLRGVNPRREYHQDYYRRRNADR